MNDFKFIDITDLPSDRIGALGKLRTELLRTYNSNRRYTEKMKLLAATLDFILKQINDTLEPEVQEEEPALKISIPAPETKKPVKAKTTRAAKRTTKRKS